MHKSCFLIIFLLLFPSLSYAGQFTVIKVSDGDTVQAQGHDIEIKVRLVGIDAPELSRRKNQPGQPYSQKSKKYLADLVLNKVVDIQGYGLDRYGRVLAVITLDGMNVNLEMVKVGLAEVYQGKPPNGFDLKPYRKAVKEARADKRGMWSQGDKYIGPKDWRKRN